MSISSIAEDSTLRLTSSAPAKIDDVVKMAAETAASAAIAGASPTEATAKGVEAAKAAPGGGGATVSTGPLSQLVKYIPTETISLYIAIQAALGDVAIPKDGKLSDADFSSHWAWTWIMLVATVCLTVGLSYRSQKNANPTQKFKLPFFDVMAAGAAFMVWALSLPSTPLRSNGGYNYTAWNSVLILGGTIAISTLAHVFGKTVAWTKVGEA